MSLYNKPLPIYSWFQVFHIITLPKTTCVAILSIVQKIKRAARKIKRPYNYWRSALRLFPNLILTFLERNAGATRIGACGI